ncbi:unnamed protein product [Pseudo-nitzschia multistriata]|uniref:Uncharacterized protein n=1 Tax=Pseudo-nitzschia multistriata TaxID=183589 RepID=A0A448ZH00_9STRA|nr:unnamed protein product [Pseudo-nitzschia multistriata]
MTMVEDDFPPFLMSNEDTTQLDSAKRCLFPRENDFSTNSIWGGVDTISKEHDDTNQKMVGKSAEQTKHSPISVVSVLNIGCPVRGFHNDKKFDDCTSSSSTLLSPSPDSRAKSDRDEVEEQTVIEVQYVESARVDRDINFDADSVEENQVPCSNQSKRAKTPLRNRTSIERNTIGDARARPLLDVEKTPSGSETKKKKSVTPSPLLGCGGYGACLPYCGDTDHQFVERKITKFLEDNSVSTPDAFKTTCTDWQAWSYFGFASPEDSSNNSPSRESIRTTLRRRTSHSLRSRKSNVRQLKRNLAPFAQSPARSPARAPSLFRNRSFSVSDHRSAIARVSTDNKPNRKSFSDVFDLCTLYEKVDLNSQDLVWKNTDTGSNENDISYDSDPEDFMRRRPTSEAKRPADNNISQSGEGGSPCYYQNSPGRSFLDPHNDEVFSNIVREMFNQTTTLVLHPVSESNTTGQALLQSARPIAVDAWLERGQHLAYALIQPKWIWKAKPKINSEGQSSVCQKFCLQGIELLDITKILKVEETEGVSHSLAKPSHCFFIKSIHDEEFCFEAKSRKERDRIVSSLKLLIARFGAKVLTGDPEVYYEFFWMTDGVPGDAPDLLEAFGLVEAEEVSF